MPISQKGMSKTKREFRNAGQIFGAGLDHSKRGSTS